MEQRTWPDRSNGSKFASFQFPNTTSVKTPPSETANFKRHNRCSPSSSSQQSTESDNQFASLPFDILARIACSFTLPNLRAASLVCKSWSQALSPLREAMLLLRWGKRFKHGRGGVRKNLDKALDCFLKGAVRGSTLAMVDAGLMYWEMGKKDDAIALYRRAAELGDSSGQCNLGLSYLQAQPSNRKEALEWLYKAANADHSRAQYQLAVCLHQSRKGESSLKEAARWYRKAADNGYVRAMYNVALCYLDGEGVPQNHSHARKWMKRAAECGHSKAQFEHGLRLFSEGDMMRAAVYLELATRAGETGANHVKNAIFQHLTSTLHDRAMLLVDRWRPLPSNH